MPTPISKSWKFCPLCAASYHGDYQSPFRCHHCDYQHYFSPNTAVGAIIQNVCGELLWIVRAKDPGKGKLGLPGGFVDVGERVEDAIVREIQEEVGLEICNLKFVASFPNTYQWNDLIYDVTDLFFMAKVAKSTTVVCQPEEISGFCWLKPDKIKFEDLAFASHWKALEASGLLDLHSE